jgi:hypothetical protein
MGVITLKEYFGKIMGEVRGQLPLEVHPEFQVRRSLVRIALIILQLLGCISQEGEHGGWGKLGQDHFHNEEALDVEDLEEVCKP